MREVRADVRDKARTNLSMIKGSKNKWFAKYSNNCKIYLYITNSVQFNFNVETKYYDIKTHNTKKNITI